MDARPGQSPGKGSGSGRANPRKTMQLCAQVRRALDVALTDEGLDPLLLDVSVDRVEPTADDGRLRVWFAVAGEAAIRPRNQLAQLLEGARPVMLREVAATINRRKIPDLAFELVRARDPDQPAAGEPGLPADGAPGSDT